MAWSLQRHFCHCLQCRNAVDATCHSADSLALAHALHVRVYVCVSVFLCRWALPQSLLRSVPLRMIVCMCVRARLHRNCQHYQAVTHTHVTSISVLQKYTISNMHLADSLSLSRRVARKLNYEFRFGIVFLICLCAPVALARRRRGKMFRISLELRYNNEISIFIVMS